MDKKTSTRAAHFKEARNNRLLEVAEDYTELIADFIAAQGQVRVCDIAREMGVSHVSVLKTIARLTRDGYLRKKEGKLELTQAGEAMAAFSKKKHGILSEFLLKLGVPEHIVATDVEGIEHHISEIALNAIDAHLRSWITKTTPS